MTTVLRVQTEPLSLESATDFQNPGHGAMDVFAGKVRDLNHGRRVTGVSYDAFPPLAENVFAELAREARARWGEDLEIRILHRIGRLNVGDYSVLIAVSSRHRDESFKACRYLIEELKHQAPIWKQEHYEDGDSEWLRGHALCQHAEAPEVTA